MAKLILSLDGQVIKEFTLTKERSTIWLSAESTPSS